MVDVVCLGEMLIDFVPASSRAMLSEAAEFKKAAGGAPANVAVGAVRLGASCAFMGKVGDDPFGRFLVQTLSSAGVDCQAVAFSKEAHTGLAFVSLRPDGEREFLFYRDPSADMLFSRADVDRDVIRSAKILHFGSIGLIAEPSRDATLYAVELAKELGVTISYDPNLRLALWPDPETAREVIRRGWNAANIVKIGEEEVEFLTGQADPLEAVRSLWHPGLRLVAITRGRAGCTFVTPDFVGHAPGVAVKAVDTTGAGDAFMGGLLAGLLGTPAAIADPAALNRVCVFANAAGALATTRLGAIPALPTRVDVESFLDAQAGPKDSPKDKETPA